MKRNLVGLLLLCQSKSIFMSGSRLSAGMKRKSTTSVDDDRKSCENDIAEGVLTIEKQLIHELTNNNLSYDASIEYIYNPLDYAFELHSKYVYKYCTSKKKILFLGMNPGPWGMVQCGIPFGEVKAVKGFLNIEGEVNQPDKFHKDRPITGLDCPRSEISGKRLWELASQLSDGKAENFFRHAYVHNYFPLAFLSKTAKNITPAELKNKITIEKLNSICDKSLSDIIQHLGVDTVIAIGKAKDEKINTETTQNKSHREDILDKSKLKSEFVSTDQHTSETLNIESTSNVEDKQDISSANQTNAKTLDQSFVADKSELNTDLSHEQHTSDTQNTEYENTSGGYIVIARGKNEVNATKNATRHAELVCIDQVVAKYAETYRKVFEYVTVIVNVEPCIMCMAALLELNIGEIVFTCVNDRFGYNILGKTDRTNYVEIVEVNSSDRGFKDEIILNTSGKRTEIEIGDTSSDEAEVNRTKHENGDTSSDVAGINTCETSLKDGNTNETDQVVNEDGEEMRTLEDNLMETTGDTESNIQEQSFDKLSKTKKYKLSLINQQNQNLVVTRDEYIANKISSIVKDDQDRTDKSGLFREQAHLSSGKSSFRAKPIRCNVFYYRKYESVTMDILKLFYKGVNPNAPKHKVKINS
ncbi:hypothetical protein WDU94_006272 [Cyamophila willieti]